MEKIMSKSNDSSKLGRATNELRDDELQKVSGGITRSLPNGKTDVIKAMGNSSPREPKKLPPILGG